MKKYKLMFPIITEKLCPHCNKKLYTQNYGGYGFQCSNCEEDFYSFEIKEKKND